MDLSIPPLFLCGIFAGVAGLTVLFGLTIGYAYREPMLWWHAATVGTALIAQLPWGIGVDIVAVLWSFQFALAMQTVRVVLGDSGAVQAVSLAARLLTGALLAWTAVQLVWPDMRGWLFLPWAGITAWYLWRAWARRVPWILWFALGQLALGVQWIMMLWSVGAGDDLDASVASLAALALFASATYIAMVWRSRLQSENNLRVQARERVDPLTGLAMPRVFLDHVEEALVRSRTLNYSSALLLVRIQNIEAAMEDLQAENNEAIVLGAAQAIASTLRAQDVAARLASNRFGVLAEGVDQKQRINDIATRIVAHGLRGADFGLPGVDLKFQVVVMDISRQTAGALQVLRRLEDALHLMATQPGCPPIRTIEAGDDFPTTNVSQVIQT